MSDAAPSRTSAGRAPSRRHHSDIAVAGAAAAPSAARRARSCSICISSAVIRPNAFSEGGAPVSISYSSTPAAHQSTANEYGWPRST